MARPPKNIDFEEVDEIVSLKLKELNGYIKKLNYNSVWEYNKKIANNPLYKRINGKLYTLYGYAFWASEYKGEDYYGKKKIDEVKKPNEIILAGEVFEVEVQDILMTIDKYYNHQDELKDRMLKIFKKDRMKIKFLREQYEDVSKKVEEKTEELKLFEEGFATLFYNSSLTDNSLNDVINIRKSKDTLVYNELKNMFNKDDSRIGKILEKSSQIDTKTDTSIKGTIISLEDRTKLLEKLEKDGL